MTSLAVIRRTKSPEKRFVSAHQALDTLETKVLPTLIDRRTTHDFDLLQEIADVQHEIATLSIERSRAIKELVEDENRSFASIAALTGDRPKLTADGDLVYDSDGNPVMTTMLSRQRVHQIYKGVREGTYGTKKKSG